MAVSHQGDTGETGTDEGGRSDLTDTWRCAGFIRVTVTQQHLCLSNYIFFSVLKG